MKRISLLFVFYIIVSHIVAQTPWAKKAYNAVFTLKTFTADGSLKTSSNGFFVSEQGVAVACYTPFVGASKATVIDASGKEYEVREILGANEMYDVVKFKVDIKKANALPLATDKAAEGSTLWLLPYSVKKAPVCSSGKVAKAELFDSTANYNYYTLDLTVNEQQTGCPLLNDEGQVVGLLQPTGNSTSNQCYAVSALFAAGLQLGGLYLNDASLRKIDIAKGIPDKQEDAVLALFLASNSLDSLHFADMLERFIVKFPQLPDGYVTRARFLAANNRCAEADDDFHQALKVSEHKDETYYQYAQLIFQKVVYQPEPAYAPWTLDRALEEARHAWEQNQLSVYQEQQAQILYAQQKYEDAYNIYEGLLKSDRHNAETFYAAAQCKRAAGDQEAGLALLDSAVNTFSRPYLRAAAPYILARAQAFHQAGKYRPAVLDFNEYANLMVGKLTAEFYYMREQSAFAGHLYQQALDDIRRAVEMKPDDPDFLAEKALVELRAGLIDDMMQTAERCIAVAPRSADAYMFLGIAQCMKERKAEGLQNLQKAKELGNSQAQSLIDKYSK